MLRPVSISQCRSSRLSAFSKRWLDDLALDYAQTTDSSTNWEVVTGREIRDLILRSTEQAAQLCA